MDIHTLIGKMTMSVVGSTGFGRASYSPVLSHRQCKYMISSHRMVCFHNVGAHGILMCLHMMMTRALQTLIPFWGRTTSCYIIKIYSMSCYRVCRLYELSSE